MIWPEIERVTSTRLVLEPLSVEHAPAMVEVLADPSLYAYTGGRPPRLEQLRRRYAVQSLGRSEDGTQGWFNWIVKLRESDAAIGYVQATVEHDGLALVGDIAWVIAPSYQRQGFASEASKMMTGWLRSKGVSLFAAFVHPEHLSSMRVARHVGLRPTAIVEAGEKRWQS